MQVEWCERRLLARIHHLTVATLRKQVEPVTRGAIYALAAALAARRSAIAVGRRTRTCCRPCASCKVSKFPRTPGRSRFWRANQRLRSRGARSALPDRSGGLGPAVAASGDAGGFRRRPPPRGAHQRCAHHLLCPRRVRLDAATPRRGRAELRTRAERERRAPCWNYLRRRGRVVLCRHRARHRQAESGDRDRAVGVGRGRHGHRRRLRQSALAHQSQAPAAARARAKRRGRATRRDAGRCSIPPKAPTATSRRSDLLDAAAPLRRGLSRECWRANRTCPSGASC